MISSDREGERDIAHPIGRETALLDDDLPPLTSRSIEADEEIVYVRRQCRAMCDLVFLCSD
jgi:hypothetical protein